jgi:hypothetical protein
MERYREVLNYAIRAVIGNKTFSLGKAHKLLYTVLKERYGLPSKIAQDCYREAIAIAKSWLNNPSRGRAPRARTPRLLLTHGYSYRVRDGYVELLGASGSGLSVETKGTTIIPAETPGYCSRTVSSSSKYPSTSPSRPSTLQRRPSRRCQREVRCYRQQRN